jgi:hypothetical protein
MSNFVVRDVQFFYCITIKFLVIKHVDQKSQKIFDPDSVNTVLLVVI